MTAPVAPLTYRAAAERVLAEAGTPLRVDEITDRALAAQLIAPQGATPAATMGSQLATSVAGGAEESPFVRVAPATYALRRWGLPASGDAPASDHLRVAWYPGYDAVRATLPVLVGMTRAAVQEMRNAIEGQRGTFAENVDWSDPDRWIPDRLAGTARATAERLWTGSGRRLNPRHVAGCWFLVTAHALVADGADGALALTDDGRDFVAHREGATVRRLDDREGLLPILALLADQGPAARGELLGPWLAWASRVSGIRADTTARTFLYNRLRNLVERALVTRVGQKYQLTDAGLAWLKASGYAAVLPAPAATAGAAGGDAHGVASTSPSATEALWTLAQGQRTATRQALRESLGAMDPYAFEHLVGRLLEVMGYTDVEVTAPAGDYGVDVVGRIALGITEVREVVQVKRQQANVGRPILDMLRGSLHRFRAVKGTIITLGGFSQGARDAAFEAGAAPITLIDGEKLLDLLIEHGIGVRTRTVEVLELDLADLVPAAEDGAA